MTSLAIAALYIASFYAVGPGSSPGDWHASSVVFAEVNAIESIGDNRYWLQMSALSTLAGSFDPALEGEFRARVRISQGRMGIDGCDIDRLPPLHAKVLVLASRLGANGPLIINDGLVPFMPNATGLLEAHGLDDQWVRWTADQLRAIRTKQHDEEEKAGKAALPAAKVATPFYELVRE